MTPGLLSFFRRAPSGRHTAPHSNWPPPNNWPPPIESGPTQRAIEPAPHQQVSDIEIIVDLASDKPARPPAAPEPPVTTPPPASDQPHDAVVAPHLPGDMRLPDGLALPILGRVVTRLHPTGYVDIGGVLVFVHSAATDAVIEGTVVLVSANRPTSAAVGDH